MVGFEAIKTGEQKMKGLFAREMVLRTAQRLHIRP